MLLCRFSKIILLFVFLFIPITALSSVDKLSVPEGFQIDEYASELGSPRFMALSPDNVLFVTIIGNGTVVALLDHNKDGKSDNRYIYKGLKRPHGIAFDNGYIYVGETNQIVRYKYWVSATNKFGRPVGLLVGDKGELYISDDLGGVIYKVTSK